MQSSSGGSFLSFDKNKKGSGYKMKEEKKNPYLKKAMTQKHWNTLYLSKFFNPRQRFSTISIRCLTYFYFLHHTVELDNHLSAQLYQRFLYHIKNDYNAIDSKKFSNDSIHF